MDKTDFEQINEVLLLIYQWNSDWGPILKQVYPNVDNFVTTKINISIAEMISKIQEKLKIKKSLGMLVELEWLKKESLLLFNSFKDINSEKHEIIVAILAKEIPQNQLTSLTELINQIVSVIKKNKNIEIADLTKYWIGIKSLFIKDNF